MKANPLPFDGSYLPKLDYNLPVQDIGKAADLFFKTVPMNVSKKTPTFYSEFTYQGINYNLLSKGPFARWNGNIQYQCFVDELKPLFGLNKIGTHLALIRSEEEAAGKYYILMRDFGAGVEHYPTMRKNGIVKIDKSKIPILQMVRWTRKHKLTDCPKLLPAYIDVLLFRQIIETSDTNNTNIIVNSQKSNPILSVDENHKGYFLQGKLFSHKPTKVWAKIVMDYIQQHKKALLDKLNDWKAVSQQAAYQQVCSNFNHQTFGNQIASNIDSLQNLLKKDKLTL